MFVVTVWFEVKPQYVSAFKDAILKNAAASLQKEPGCRQFDVCVAQDERSYFLYELYADEQAFKDHRATEHFLQFDLAAKEMITSKRLETYMRLANPHLQ